MSYASKIIIEESKNKLTSTYQKVNEPRTKLMVKALILFKEGNFQKQEDLASHLCIGYSTLRRWLKKYTDEGLEKYIKDPTRGKPKSMISDELHEALEEKLYDSQNPLQSYLDAVIWVKDNYDIEIKYQTLRKYMITHFKTKLKVPRKSHYKKDEQAIEAFFKTT